MDEISIDIDKGTWSGEYVTIYGKGDHNPD